MIKYLLNFIILNKMNNTNLKPFSPVKTVNRYAEVKCAVCSNLFSKHFKTHWKIHKLDISPQGTVDVKCSDTGNTMRISYHDWNR